MIDIHITENKGCVQIETTPTETKDGITPLDELAYIKYLLNSCVSIIDDEINKTIDSYAG